MAVTKAEYLADINWLAPGRHGSNHVFTDLKHISRIAIPNISKIALRGMPQDLTND